MKFPILLFGLFLTTLAIAQKDANNNPDALEQEKNKNKTEKYFRVFVNNIDTNSELAISNLDSLKSILNKNMDCNAILYRGEHIMVLLYSRGVIAKATQYGNWLLDITKECGDSTYLPQLLNTIGNILKYQGDFEGAINTYKKVFDLNPPKTNKALAYVNVNISTCYQKIGELDLALEYANEGQKYYENIESSLQGNPYQCIGDVYLLKKEYKLAKFNLFKALSFNTVESPMDRRLLTSINNSISRYYLNINQFDSSIIYARIASKIANDMSLLTEQIICLQNLAFAYEGLNRFDSAFNYQKRMSSINDSLLQRSKIHEARNIMMAYEIKKDSLKTAQQRELDQLNYEANLAQEKFNRNLMLLALAAILIIGFIVQRGITRRKRIETEKLLELDQFKTRFFTNISHEFRTPLTIIQGVPELLEQNYSDKSETRFKSNLQTIKRNSKRLLNLIEQILDLSKLEAGKLNLDSKPYDLNEILRFQLSAYHSYLDFKGLKMISEYSDSEAVIEADLKALNHIIHNLVSNAIKYTEQGEVFVRVENNDETVKLIVKDTGKGIKEEDIPHIFDRFYRTESVETEGFAGTGLGLSLTKELINLLKAEIIVRSTIGEGSSFEVVFKCSKKQPERIETDIAEVVDTPKLELANIEEEKDNSVSSKLKILIVEDTPDMQDYMVQILRNDYDIQTAINGEDGLKMAQDQTPDFIISDWMMPKMNGPEMIQLLKSEVSTSHIPVMLLTARSDQESRLEGLAVGAEAYLAKPFDVNEFKAQVKTLIEARQKLRIYLNNNEASEQIDVYDADKEFLEKTIQFINDNLSDSSLDREKLSDIHNLGPNQFYRKLKAITGEGVTQFLRNIRLKKAKRMLREKRLTISEIAWECGFNDPSYFTRIFTQDTGVAPSEYQA
ncbi:MAG: response regulator [Cytophagales bacterium]